jgi:hypothetical protein
LRKFIAVQRDAAHQPSRVTPLSIVGPPYSQGKHPIPCKNNTVFPRRSSGEPQRLLNALIYKAVDINGTSFAIASDAYLKTGHDFMDDTTILIADSETVFSKRLARHFTENGLNVSVYNDVSIALHHLAGGKYDIAVIEFCASSIRQKAYVPLSLRPPCTEIILTCRSHTVDSERAARALSPAFFFVKPVRVSDVYAVVLRIIEMKNRRTMLARQRRDLREGVCNG